MPRGFGPLDGETCPEKICSHCGGSQNLAMKASRQVARFYPSSVGRDTLLRENDPGGVPVLPCIRLALYHRTPRSNRYRTGDCLWTMRQLSGLLLCLSRILDIVTLTLLHSSLYSSIVQISWNQTSILLSFFDCKTLDLDMGLNPHSRTGPINLFSGPRYMLTKTSPGFQNLD